MRSASSNAPPRPVLLDVLGVRVAIDAGGHTAAAQVEALWSRCLVEATDDGDTAAEHEIALPRTDRPLAIDVALGLTDDLIEAAVTAASGRLLLLRAAAVATPDGSVLGLLAPTGGGRTTVVAELARRGFCYVTDELLAVAESLEVLPFAAPLTFDQPGQPRALAGPDALGLRACGHELYLAGLVMLERVANNPGPPELTRLSAPAGPRRLADAVLSTPGSVPATQALAGVVAAIDGVWVLRYADARDAAGQLVRLLDERTSPVLAPEVLYVAVGIGEVDDDGRTVRARGHQVELDDLRRSVWLAAAGGASMASLHAAANRDLAGVHHISVALVSAAVDDLLALGLLVDAGRSRRRGGPAVGSVGATG
jgi:hypothetical protein